MQKYLVFLLVSRYFKTVANTNRVRVWKPKGLSDQSIKPSSKSDYILNPGINYADNAKIRIKLDESCLKQDKLTFTHKQMVNIYIVYEINLWPLIVGKDFAFGNFLFEAAKWIKMLIR